MRREVLLINERTFFTVRFLSSPRACACGRRSIQQLFHAVHQNRLGEFGAVRTCCIRSAIGSTLLRVLSVLEEDEGLELRDLLFLVLQLVSKVSVLLFSIVRI